MSYCFRGILMITCYPKEIPCPAPHYESGKKEERPPLLCLRKSENGPVADIEPLGTFNSEGACKSMRNSGNPFTETGLCSEVSEAMHSNGKAAGVLVRPIISIKRQKIHFLLFPQRCLNSCPLSKPCVLSPVSHHSASH